MACESRQRHKTKGHSGRLALYEERDLLAKYENRSPQSAAIEGLTKTMKQAFEAGKL
jgi:hypothetical protein